MKIVRRLILLSDVQYWQESWTLLDLLDQNLRVGRDGETCHAAGSLEDEDD
jgi:hypothetical protein